MLIDGQSVFLAKSLLIGIWNLGFELFNEQLSSTQRGVWFCCVFCVDPVNQNWARDALIDNEIMDYVASAFVAPNLYCNSSKAKGFLPNMFEWDQPVKTPVTQENKQNMCFWLGRLLGSSAQ